MLLLPIIALTQRLHLPPCTPNMTPSVASTHGTVTAKYSPSNEIDPVFCMSISELNRLCPSLAFHYTQTNGFFTAMSVAGRNKVAICASVLTFMVS